MLAVAKLTGRGRGEESWRDRPRFSTSWARRLADGIRTIHFRVRIPAASTLKSWIYYALLGFSAGYILGRFLI